MPLRHRLSVNVELIACPAIVTFVRSTAALGTVPAANARVAASGPPSTAPPAGVPVQPMKSRRDTSAAAKAIGRTEANGSGLRPWAFLQWLGYRHARRRTSIHTSSHHQAKPRRDRNRGCICRLPHFKAAFAGMCAHTHFSVTEKRHMSSYLYAQKLDV